MCASDNKGPHMRTCLRFTGGSQHDSGTAGHEPDSLEAMRTVLSEEPTAGCRTAPSPHSVELEPAVLLHLERSAHRKTRRQLQLLQNGVRSVIGGSGQPQDAQVSYRTVVGQSQDASGQQGGSGQPHYMPYHPQVVSAQSQDLPSSARSVAFSRRWPGKIARG